MEYRKVLLPRTDLVSILLGHDPGDLGEMSEVVHHPRRKELPSRHRTEGRMLRFEEQLFRRDPKLGEPRQILSSQPFEPVQTIRQ